MKKILFIFFLLACSPLHAGGYLGDFQIGDTVYFSAAFNDTTGTRYENTAGVAGRLYRGGAYIAAPTWAELDDVNLAGVWQASQDTTGYTAGQYTMVVWGTIDSSKAPQTTLTFNLYAATGKQVDIESLGGVAQSLTDLKDFADAGYDPSAHKIETCKVNDDMKGTDGANTVVPDAAGVAPTAGEIRIEMEGAGHKLAAIEADTNELQTNQGNWTTATGFSVPNEYDAVIAALQTDLDNPAQYKAGVSSLALEATLTAMKGATFSGTTDSLEAIRNRGDDAWVTGAGGSAPTVGEIRAEMEGAGHKLAAIEADTNELQTNQGNWTTATGFSVPNEYDTVIAALQTDLDNPAQYKADVSSLALEATLTAMKGATFSGTTDSLEAIRNRGDDAWATGAGGSAPTVGEIRAEMEGTGYFLDLIKADTNELQTNQGAWATAAGFSTHSAADIWSVGTRALTDKAGFSLSAAGINSIFNEEIDNDGTAISLGGAIKLMLSVLTGESSGGGTATLTFRDLADTKNRITATVSDVGNRTAVTRDAE